MKAVFICLFFLSLCHNDKVYPQSKNKTTETVPADSTTPFFYGQWLIHSFTIPEGFVNGENDLTAKEAKSYIRKVVVFNHNTVSIMERACSPVAYRTTLVNSDDYFYDNYKVIVDTLDGRTTGVDKARIGIIRDTVTMTEVECGDLYCELFQISSDEIIMSCR